MGRHLNGSAAEAPQLGHALPAWTQSVAVDESAVAADLWSLPEHTPGPPGDGDEGTADRGEPPAPTEHLLAAWMGALAGSDRAERLVERDGSADVDANTGVPTQRVSGSGRDHSPNGVLPADSEGGPFPDGRLLPDDGFADAPRATSPSEWPTADMSESVPPMRGVPSMQRRASWRSVLATVLISLTASTAAGVATVLLVAGRDDLGGLSGVVPANVRPAQPDGRVVVPGAPAGCETMLVKPWPDGTTAHVGGTCFTVG